MGNSSSRTTQWRVLTSSLFGGVGGEKTCSWVTKGKKEMMPRSLLLKWSTGSMYASAEGQVRLELKACLPSTSLKIYLHKVSFILFIKEKHLLLPALKHLLPIFRSNTANEKFMFCMCLLVLVCTVTMLEPKPRNIFFFCISPNVRLFLKEELCDVASS